ncbi:truncated hemoglobin [Catenuloplanes indicus]|uniref:Truncated hemoglobin YjbI n=1 Tax=Catenuloplanes indicus TaxID=137267 RepID=A0AAE3VX24_9ACTN|nr:hypothetical protein [Catenuloplanes indicus]MDQ0365406.1 truncated hemoglobin YjbI [Catenuloplanes indicus]
MTLYESIGGEAAVGAAVDEFYRRVVNDPDLAGCFAGAGLARLTAHQRAFIAAAPAPLRADIVDNRMNTG